MFFGQRFGYHKLGSGKSEKGVKSKQRPGLLSSLLRGCPASRLNGREFGLLM